MPQAFTLALAREIWGSHLVLEGCIGIVEKNMETTIISY